MFRDIGGLASLLYVFIFIPAFIRDFCYDLVAKNRFIIFGKTEACKLPDPVLRKRINRKRSAPHAQLVGTKS